MNKRPLAILAAMFVAAIPPLFAAEPASLQQLQQMSARYAPTPLVVDTAALSAGDRQALVKLIQAARLIDTLYMKQLWGGDLALYGKLRADSSPLGQARLHYFWLNKGPWSDLDEFQAFLPGVPARKPLGAAFYPDNMTKAQFESWAAALPAAQAEKARGFYSVIRADGNALRNVPYSEAYRDDLVRLAALLRAAAALTDNASLRRFLETRAAAFLSDDYYASDVAWMDLDAPLDITIGPYETYGDELFGYKAAFEAYINLRDAAESAKLAFFGRHLQELENNLPEDPQYRNAKLGALAPIVVVNQIISSGDGAHGPMTAAYNLPNDDRVVAEKGSKRVMLKNVHEAKFRKTLVPIAQRVLTADAQQDLSFEWFFTHIVAHELMHGLGPHQITVAGRSTNPRLELKDAFSAIEEAKADVTGLWALQYLMDHAAELQLQQALALTPRSERQLYTTYLASMFRTLRFGVGDAHGRGMVMQMNFLMERGAVRATSDGHFEVDFAKIKDAVRALDHELLTVEASGDLAGARRLLGAARVRPEVQRALGRLADLPTDIEPQFTTADQLAPP
ncbi:MAG: hypothetical protein QM718_07965 [Steroidobacteraceae bacterium]